MTHKSLFNLTTLLMAATAIVAVRADAQEFYGLTPDADTYITNGGGSGPTSHHGGKSSVEVRWYDDGSTTRIRMGYVRFDIAGINPEFFTNEVTLSGTFTGSSYNGPGVWDVYGLNDTITAVDTLGVDWDDSEISYSNAAGVVNDAPVGTFGFTSDATMLGTLTLDGVDEQPLPFISNGSDLDFSSFLNADTDGLVTLLFISSTSDGKEYRIDSSEGSTSNGHGPMTLNFMFPAGDVDGYNGVDLADLQVIADNFRQSANSRLDGDLSADGFVDFADFELWKQNYTGSLAGVDLGFLSAKVPEPSTLWLAAVGAGLLLVRRLKVNPRVMVIALVLLGVGVASSSFAQVTYYFKHPDYSPYPADNNWFTETDNNPNASGGTNWYDPVGAVNFIPDYSQVVDERAAIDFGGTVVVDTVGAYSPASLTISSSSGLDVLGTGALSIRAGTDTNGELNVSSGAVSVLSGGSLTSEGSFTIGGSSSLAIGAGATVGTDSSLSLTGSYQVGVAGNANNGFISAGTSATVGGQLVLDFTGYTPAATDTWTVVEADSITGDFSSLSWIGGLAPNQSLATVQTDLGGGRVGITAMIEERLVLQVNRDTGAATIMHPGSSSITLDGYYVGSDLGMLSDKASDWTSLVESGQLGSDWIETSQTTSNIGELKIGADATFGSDVALGSIYKPLAGTFAGDTEDLQFVYRRSSDGKTFTGRVEYTGSKVNNLVLQVDPSGSGDVYLRNTSSTTVEIDAYEILSSSGALSEAGWNSLAEQSATTNTWLEALDNGASLLAEFDTEGFTTIGPGAAINLGPLYTGSTQDLQFNFLLMGDDEGTAGAVMYGAFTADALPGDYNEDNIVNLADYTVWRDNLGSGVLPNDNGLGTVGYEHYELWKANFGSSLPISGVGAVPEPSSWLLLAIAVAGLGYRLR
ncbi:PEP-CTERM sorting domain-containing protein [Aeoliella mucimassa]|uniref:PEP-CTERM motif protein n=1 Tax=Aeoliella mucimassa TaxID=2527972 RepID=A0A518AP93_9BACT|nr:PEP-CTERM sorting domain-containing protein [Aeoliella mucimassa]QDU56549.1 PEP-CTERM motif protein [Aeoliella mucimassa]